MAVGFDSGWSCFRLNSNCGAWDRRLTPWPCGGDYCGRGCVDRTADQRADPAFRLGPKRGIQPRWKSNPHRDGAPERTNLGGRPSHAACAGWLPRLAEAVGGQRLEDDEQSATCLLGRSHETPCRTRLNYGHDDPSHGPMAGLVLAIREARLISPSASLTVTEHLHQRMEDVHWRV